MRTVLSHYSVRSNWILRGIQIAWFRQLMILLQWTFICIGQWEKSLNGAIRADNTKTSQRLQCFCCVFSGWELWFSFVDCLIQFVWAYDLQCRQVFNLIAKILIPTLTCLQCGRKRISTIIILWRIVYTGSRLQSRNRGVQLRWGTKSASLRKNIILEWYGWDWELDQPLLFLPYKSSFLEKFVLHPSFF